MRTYVEMMQQEVDRAVRARLQSLEMTLGRWCRGDSDLTRGIVWEQLADGREILRVIAGPYWAEGQAGAGPALIELPPIRLKVSDV